MEVGSREREILVCLLDEAYDRPAWHGPNLRAAMRGISADRAAWKPDPGRNSVWELALHCAYWKYVVRRRLVGGARGIFPRRPANFPAPPEDAGPAAWRADLALLEEQHRLLREAVTALPEARLWEGGARVRPVRMVYGIAAHDLYHAGQIRLLSKLSARRNDPKRR